MSRKITRLEIFFLMASESIDRDKSMLFIFLLDIKSLCFSCNYKVIFIDRTGLNESRHDLRKNTCFLDLFIGIYIQRLLIFANSPYFVLNVICISGTIFCPGINLK